MAVDAGNQIYHCYPEKFHQTLLLTVYQTEVFLVGSPDTCTCSMDVMENILNDKNVIVIRVLVNTVVTISQAPYEFRPHHCSVLQMKKLGYSQFQRGLHPSPWNLGICQITWQRGIQISDGVRLLIS